MSVMSAIACSQLPRKYGQGDGHVVAHRQVAVVDHALDRAFVSGGERTLFEPS